MGGIQIAFVQVQITFTDMLLEHLLRRDNHRMFRRLPIIVIFCCLFPLHAQAQNASTCRRFVAGFYTWYADNAQKTSLDPLEVAMKERPEAFDSGLLKMIQSSKQSTPEGDAWLDFDPILNTQDPSYKYAIGHVSVKGNRCWADVYAATKSQRSRSMNVRPELLFDQNGRWRLYDFHYAKYANKKDSLRKLLK